MKLHFSFAALWLWWTFLTIDPVAAQKLSPAEAFKDLSTCTLTCLFGGLPTSGCRFADVECQCTSTKLVEVTFGCLLDNCTVQELVLLGRAREKVCDIPNDLTRGPTMKITTAALVAISTTLVLVKLFARLSTEKTLWVEDWLVLVADSAAIAGCSLIFWLVDNGYSRHTYFLDSPAIARLFKRYFVVEFIYLLGMLFAKLAILRLYLTLLPGRITRIATKVTMVLVTLTSVTIILFQLNQCHPVAKSWNKDLAGTCLQLNEIVLASTGVNIGQDVLILLIPIPTLLSLDVKIQQKIGMLFLFGLYAFALTTSIVRIQFIRNLGKYLVDPAYDDAPGTMWSIIDIHISIICACLPSLPGCIRRLCACGRRVRGSYNQDSHISLRSGSPFHPRREQPRLQIPGSKPTAVDDSYSPTDIKEPRSANESECGHTVSTRWSQTTFAQSTWTTPTTPTRQKGSRRPSEGWNGIAPFSKNVSEPIKWEEEDEDDGKKEPPAFRANTTQPLDWGDDESIEEEGTDAGEGIGVADGGEARVSSELEEMKPAEEAAIGVAS